MRRRSGRVLRALLALTMAALLAIGELAPVLAVTQAQIDARKKDIAAIRTEKKNIQAKLDKLAGDKTQALQQKALLDQQIAATTSEIEHQEELIAQYDDLIAQRKAELADAEEREAAQYELFCKRVRAMEEQGEISYWSVLFKADSFTDLLSRVDFIHEIMDADQRVIDNLKALQAELVEAKAAVEASRAQSEEAKTELEGQRTELDAQRSKANKLIEEIRANEAEYKSTLDSIAKEEEDVQAEIVRLSRELAAQQAAAAAAAGNSAPAAALGGYIWPVPSRRINSPYGSREGGGIVSSTHKGVDIGGVGYTTQVLAAKAGTVIVSQSHSSYGNYVVVSHGSGNTTLYAHMSKRSVKVGDVVGQGQVLGITGSTGNSTGPHLHFEITENGSRIDPLKYLTGYVKAW